MNNEQPTVATPINESDLPLAVSILSGLVAGDYSYHTRHGEAVRFAVGLLGELKALIKIAAERKEES